MWVEWTFTPQPEGVLVRIEHELRLSWPLIGGVVADHVIGPQFVAHIAGKTLHRIKQIAEDEERRADALRSGEVAPHSVRAVSGPSVEESP
jgi:hypothetical protein